jgi:16S rRNA (adenine1518-N6/adenine1519-N6)-dimethyltransferase
VVNDLLKAHGLRAQKRLGQNFLCDRNSLNRIVDAAELGADDPVLEIGGGLGSLTVTLAGKSPRVTTVEIDHLIEPLLRAAAAHHPNVELVFGDFLKLDHKALFDQAFAGKSGTVVANIPYYISSPILEILLENKLYLRKIVLLVQKEFAQRVVAAPGSDECGSLSLYAQYHASAKIAGSVSRSVFLPVPDVDSSILALTPIHEGAVTVADPERMLALVRAGFGQRRKTLLNALMRAPASYGLNLGMTDRELIEAILQKAGVDPMRRGETLNLHEYARIADASLELHP